MAKNLGSATYAALAAAAKAIAAETPCEWAIVQNAAGSAGSISIGGSAAQELVLAPGASTDRLPLGDVSQVWIRRTVAGTAATANLLWGF